MRGVQQRRTFDFSRYDPADRRSRIALQIALADEETRRASDAARDVLMYAMAVSLTPGNIEWAARTKFRKQALESLELRYHLEFPWTTKDNPGAGAAAASTAATDVDALVAAWQAIYGDPSDPAVQKRIQTTADRLMAPVKALQQQRGRKPKNAKVSGS